MGRVFVLGSRYMYLACGLAIAVSLGLSYISYRYGGVANFIGKMLIPDPFESPEYLAKHKERAQRSRSFDRMLGGELDNPSEKAQTPSTSVDSKPVQQSGQLKSVAVQLTPQPSVEELPFRLVGINGGSGSDALAIIEHTESGDSDVVSAGETVSPGIEVLSIMSDHILVGQQGHERKVVLSRGASVAEAREGVLAGDSRSIQHIEGESDNLYFFDGVPVYLLTKQEGKEIRNGSLVELGMSGTFHFAEREGERIGIQFSDPENLHPLIERLGVKDGDVVTALNGIPIRGTLDFFTVAKTLGPKWLDIELDRGGTSVSHSVALDR